MPGLFAKIEKETRPGAGFAFFQLLVLQGVPGRLSRKGEKSENHNTKTNIVVEVVEVVVVVACRAATVLLIIVERAAPENSSQACPRKKRVIFSSNSYYCLIKLI